MASAILTRENGPFKYDVYLGFGVCDLQTMLRLQEKLEQRDILCYPKYNAGYLQQSVKSAVVEGVARSRKCLLYVSQAFIEDQLYKYEMAEVLYKVRRFSRDMLIVLKDPQLARVPPELQTYCVLTITDLSRLENPGFVDNIAAALKKEPSPALAVMPKENIGYGSAFGYFYGYLRLVLPEFQKRLEEETLAGRPEFLQRTVRKMLIIMPESCYCPPQFNEAGKIEHTERFVVRSAHRAGNKNRDYKSSLYKIIDQNTNEEYYFVGELATPLLTLYETYWFGLSGMTRDQLYTERDCFYFTLDAILSHPDNRECNGQYKMLYWHNDPAMNGFHPKQFYDFILPEIREELEAQATQNSTKGSPNILSEIREELEAQAVQIPRKGGGLQRDSAGAGHDVYYKKTYIDVPVSGPTPAALYESLNQYKMKSDPRGRCLIINMTFFDKGPVPLHPRTGADKDVEILQQLFMNLKFRVEVHNDLTMETLERLLLSESAIDHTDFDAFVCCFLTHGKLGVLYTSDAKPIRILDIVQYFDDVHCESLTGKPKMFFIQACLTGADNSPTQSRSSSPGRTPMQSDEAQQHKTIDSTSDRPVNGVHVNGLEPVESLAMGIEASTLDWDANVTPTLGEADIKTWCEGRATLVPGRPDFLMSYATLPGASAYRDREVGSLYVSELGNCLRQGLEIDRALKMVSGGVSKELRKRDIEDHMSRFQLPFHLTSGMDKLIML